MSECPHLELVGGQQRLAWECALLKGSNCHWKQHEDCPRYLTARAEAALAALADLREVADDLKKSVITLRQFIHDLSGEDGLEDDDRVRIGLIDECALDNVLNALAAWKKAHP